MDVLSAALSPLADDFDAQLQDNCPVCLDPYTDAMVYCNAHANHRLCVRCAIDLFNKKDKRPLQCLICNQPMEKLTPKAAVELLRESMIYHPLQNVLPSNDLEGQQRDEHYMEAIRRIDRCLKRLINDRNLLTREFGEGAAEFLQDLQFALEHKELLNELPDVPPDDPLDELLVEDLNRSIKETFFYMIFFNIFFFILFYVLNLYKFNNYLIELILPINIMLYVSLLDMCNIYYYDYFFYYYLYIIIGFIINICLQIFIKTGQYYLIFLFGFFYTDISRLLYSNAFAYQGPPFALKIIILLLLFNPICKFIVSFVPI